MLQTQTVYPGTLSLLRQIMDLPELSGYGLAGGTALALQIGHRISVDLDFFGNEEIPHEEALSALSVFDKIQVVSKTRAILTCVINDVKVDLVMYRYPLLQPLQLQEGIRLYSLPDIAAMKLNAIIGRGKRRDFTDLYFLLQHFSFEQMVGFFQTKYADGSIFLLFKSLSYFEEADMENEPQLLHPVPWEKMKDTIKQAINSSI